MPNIRDCAFGCNANAEYMCRHRFGTRTWVCNRPRDAVPVGSPEGTREKPFNRFKDLEVVYWCLDRIRQRWTDRKGQARLKRFVLTTHDMAFLADAQKQYGKGMSSPEPSLTFGRDWVQAGSGKQAIRLEVLTLQGGLGRDIDLRTVVRHCRQLRKTEPSRPHS